MSVFRCLRPWNIRVAVAHVFNQPVMVAEFPAGLFRNRHQDGNYIRVNRRHILLLLDIGVHIVHLIAGHGVNNTAPPFHEFGFFRAGQYELPWSFGGVIPASISKVDRKSMAATISPAARMPRIRPPQR
jgi:hypothetical protein